MTYYLKKVAVVFDQPTKYTGVYVLARMQKCYKSRQRTLLHQGLRSFWCCEGNLQISGETILRPRCGFIWDKKGNITPNLKKFALGKEWMSAPEDRPVDHALAGRCL